ncbi:DUF1771-domain-containing protein [Ascobolus immersus RN42]|uniref:DUF1771-domain-containing protein n=1 Tax=Ascobolus immersus RN42 TaxID=1160509 RepID=A0A3N4IMB4_ASCIM|nr:DUF1771-domain-containing protein [Ascobolus immersus RN42]
MSFPLTERTISRPDPNDTAEEQEYDRLRGLARAAHGRRAELSKRSQAAYQSGDKAAAHELSQQSKKEQANADRYNREARDYIFRVNNAGRNMDEVDLHGLYVNEAVEIVRERLQAERSRGGKGLWVIVGRGNHSEGGVAKIKPAVEQFCREEGLDVEVDERNPGRVWIAIGGHHGGPGHGGSGGHGGHHGGHPEEDRGLLKRILVGIARKIKKQICTIM